MGTHGNMEIWKDEQMERWTDGRTERWKEYSTVKFQRGDNSQPPIINLNRSRVTIQWLTRYYLYHIVIHPSSQASSVYKAQWCR